MIVESLKFTRDKNSLTLKVLSYPKDVYAYFTKQRDPVSDGEDEEEPTPIRNEETSIRGRNSLYGDLNSWVDDLREHTPVQDGRRSEFIPFAINLSRERYRPVKCIFDTEENESKYKCKPVLRKVSYVYNYDTQKVEVYAMPLVVWNSVQNCILERSSTLFDLENNMKDSNIDFVINRSGSGLSTRYSVAIHRLVSDLSFQIENVIDVLLRDHDIITILKNDLKIEIPEIPEKPLNRFDILDFDT